jgi:CheY-like chemotaxis protein
VIDDEADVREALAAVLESEGYSVVQAAGGREALHQLRGEESFCLILLDLFMPGMNGWAFREEQMKDPRLAGIPVLVVSADPAAARRALTHGVVGAMTKPVEFDRLLRIVEAHC